MKVRDRGCGIADVQKAMEPLFTTGGSKRAGLGFAVMQELMDEVRVTSRVGGRHHRAPAPPFKPENPVAKGGYAKMPVTAEPKPVIGQDTSVENNLGLVHACAHRFKGRGIEYDDLFQAGCMGLVKASAAFDAGRGVMFSTYAVPVILGEIRRLFRDGGTVKVSRSLKELGLAAGRVRELLGSELGREATIAEVAGRMNRTPEEVAQALAATTPPLSLTGGEEDGSGQIDLPEESPEERLSDLLSLHQLLAGLEERDRRLIFLRYYRGKTQTEVARQLGMTQVQVSRREKRLLQAMREQLVG